MSVIKQVSALMVQRGYRVPTTTIYNKMREWVDFYMGEVPDFHRFGLKTIDGRNHTVTKPSLNMMKLVCETYSSLLWNEKSKLKVDESNQEAFDMVVEDNNIYGELNTFLEKVALYGTGVAIEYTADKKTKVGFSYGNSLVITDYQNTTPKGIVVIQRIQRNDKFYTHLSIHTYKDGIYRLEHEVYKSGKKEMLGRKQKDLTPIFTEEESASLRKIVMVDGKEKVQFYVEHKTDTPHFQVFKYNIANNFDFSPMGINVCANSIGLLKSIDEKNFSALEDSINSRKKIFFDEESSKSTANKSYDENNNRIVEDYVEYIDRDQTLYKTARLGEDTEKLKIYAPDYAPETHNTAIQFDINLLSIKVGLGTNYFDFENGGVYVNEASVFSSNSDMWRNRQANANLLKIFLTNMSKSIAYLEGMNNEEYVVEIDDSMIQDDAALKAHSMELVSQGYKPKWKHLFEWEGYTEEEAKELVAEAQAEEDTLAFDFINEVEEVEEDDE